MSNFRNYRCRQTSSTAELIGVIQRQAALLDEAMEALRERGEQVNRLLAVSDRQAKLIEYWKTLAESRAEHFELAEIEPVNRYVH